MFGAALLGAVLAGGPAVAGVVEPAVAVVVRPVGEEILRGRVTAFDGEAFDLRLSDGSTRSIPWARLEPERVLQTQQKLLARDDARGWFELGAMLFAREGGAASGEQAMRRAVALDASLQPALEKLHAGEVVTWDELKDAPTAGAGSGGGASPGGDDGGDGTGGGSGSDTPAAGPVTIGDVQAQFWGELAPDLLASSTQELKQRAQEAQQQLGVRLALYEDNYFLFYSDLPPAEARRWAALLEQMYDRLLETFALEKGKNIFRGKCLIYVFRQEADYHRYHRALFATDSTGSAGLCRSYGNGFTEVSFFRQADEINFAHVLVHESVHAFVHRYRSYPRVPSWINEGLAEYIAFRLVDSKGFGESDWAKSLDDGIRELRTRGSFGGPAFFDAAHIEAWQYPAARLLCEFMIVQDPQRYRGFINALKDGKPWGDALREDYGTSLERLVSAFGARMRIRDLKP